MRPSRYCFLFFPVLFLLSVSCAIAQQTVVIYDSIAQLETRFHPAGNQTIIINFWATWCGPCVQELPYFEQLHEHYTGPNVQVLLVSLDFRTQLQKRLLPFLKNNNITAEVALLADQNANYWIPRIHASWDGALPVTLVLQGTTRSFHQGEFENYEDLESFVTPYIGALYAPKR